MYYFSLVAFKIFFYFFSFYDICQGMYFFVYPVQICSFFSVDLYLLSSLRIFQPLFLRKFLAPASFSFPSGTSVEQMIDLWLLPHIFLRLCTFKNLFSLCCSDWIISIDLSLCFLIFSSSVISFLLLSSSKEYINVSYCIFNSKIFIWFFFVYSVSLLGLFIFPCISRVFIISCGSIFMIIALKFLLDKCNIWIISVLASVGYLFSLELRVYWFLVWHIILDCILDSLNIMLWHSGCYLIFYFISQQTLLCSESMT